MAGIGFRLNKYFGKRDLIKNLFGSFYSIFIATGPWLITIVSIAFISITLKDEVSSEQFNIFKSLITYCFAFSLIIFGLFEMPLTRFLADKLYLKNITNFTSTFFFMISVLISFSTLISMIFLYYIDIDFYLKLCTVFLFDSILVTWTAMVFLSASKQYKTISSTFFLGGVISIFASLQLGEYYGMIGYYLGFATGQSFVAMILAMILYLEFGKEELEYVDLDYYFKKHYKLIAIGFLYYMGIWIDKFIFWFGDHGEQIMGWIYNSPNYDSAMFLSYLSVIPSFAVFLINIETKFYVKYNFYFKSIESKKNLFFLNECIADMILTLRATGVQLLKIQTFSTVLIWIFAENIISWLQMPSTMVPVFRYGLLGSYFHVMFLIINILLLYFEREKEVLINYGLFFFLNLSFSLATQFSDLKFHGLGYVMATFLTLIVSYYQLNKKLLDTNYLVFMKQGLSGLGQNT